MVMTIDSWVTVRGHILTMEEKEELEIDGKQVDNSVMRGRVHARRTLKGLVADLRL